MREIDSTYFTTVPGCNVEPPVFIYVHKNNTPTGDQVETFLSPYP